MSLEDNITDGGWQHVLYLIKNLIQELHVYDCDKITDDICYKVHDSGT